MKIKLSLLDRILAKCVLGVTSYANRPCWLWTASCCNKNYPTIQVREGTRWIVRRAHRVLWELEKGRAIREGYTLDHLCLNTRCIRPDHMEEVSRPVNTARGNATRHKRKEMRVW